MDVLGGHGQLLALLHGVLVEVEELGPGDEADADAAERGRQPHAQEHLTLIRGVGDGGGDPTSNCDGEGRHGTPVRAPLHRASAAEVLGGELLAAFVDVTHVTTSPCSSSGGLAPTSRP